MQRTVAQVPHELYQAGCECCVYAMLSRPALCLRHRAQGGLRELRGIAVNDTAKDALTRLLENFAHRPNPICVVKKSAYWHQRAAGMALLVVTFGGQRTYLSHYVTTLGH